MTKHSEYIKGDEKLEIFYDPDPESPECWNEEFFLVYDHSQFKVKKEGFDLAGIFDHLIAKKIFEEALQGENEEDIVNTREDLEEFKNYSENYWIFPVAAYIHSGVSLTALKGFDNYRGNFDTSLSGFYFVSRREISEEEKAFECAQSGVETWNEYLAGEVYGFQVSEKKEYKKVYKDGTEEEEFEWIETDSCWGYYGDEGIKQILKENEFSEEDRVG